MRHPLIAAIEALPVFAWAHCARPEFVHHAVKDLWLKVSPQQVENYIEPLVLLEDVRSALNAALQPAPECAHEFVTWIHDNVDRGMVCRKCLAAPVELPKTLLLGAAETSGDAAPLATKSSSTDNPPP